MPDFETLTVRIIGDSSSFQRAMATSAAAASGFSTKAKAIGGSMSKFVTLPLVAAGAASVKMAADFEQSITNAVSVTGLAGKAAVSARNDMSTLAKTLGAETAFSAKDAADAMYDLASAGWKTTDMGKGLRGIMDLAAATQSDLQMTTEAVTSAMSQFGLKTSESGRVADVYTKAISATRATMDSLSAGMKMVGPVANSLGFSIEETTAALGMLNNAGIEGTAAGTALRGALSALMNPVGQSAEALKNMGLSADQVNPKTKSLAEILNTLKSAGMSTKDAVMLFGREAAPAMLTLADKGGGALNKLTESLEKSGGTAEKVAKTQMNTLAGQSDQLLGSLETLGIAIGTVLIPPLTSLVKSLIPLVNWFTNLPKGVQTTIVALAGVAAAAGPAIWALGSMVGAVGPLMGALAPVAAFLTGPFGIAILAAVAAGGLIIANWDQISKAVQPVIQAFKTFAAFTKPLREQLGSALVGALKALVLGFTSAIPGLNNFKINWAGIGDAISDVIKRAIPIAIQGLKMLVSAVKAITPALGTIGKIVGTVVVAGFRAWAAVLKFAWKVASGFVKGVIQLFKGLSKAPAAVVNAWRAMTNGINSAAKSVAKAVKSIGTGAVNLLKNAWNGLKGIASGAWNAVKSVVSGAWNAIKKLVTGAAKAVSGVIKSAWNQAKQITQSVWNGIKGLLTSVWNAIKSLVTGAAKAVGNAVKSAWNAIKSTTSSVWNAIKSATSSAWNAIKTSVSNRVNEAKNTAISTVKGLAKSLGGLWEQIKNTAGSKLEEWKNTLVGKFKSAKEGALGWITDLWNGIKNFLSQLGINVGGESSKAKPRKGKRVKKFARGGIATEPGIVGEGGDPEAVVNLRKRTPESENALRAILGSGKYAFAMPPKQSWDLYGGDKVVGAHEGNMGPFSGMLKSVMGDWKGAIGSGNDATVNAGTVPGGAIGVTTSGGQITIESSLSESVAAAVLKHELGHAAGLGHGGSGIMRPTVGAGMDVTSDDIAALQKYYGTGNKGGKGSDKYRGDKKPGGGGGGKKFRVDPGGGGGRDHRFPDGGRISRRILRNVPDGGDITRRKPRRHAKSANALGPTHYGVVPEVKKIADRIAEETGTSWNTYVGHGLLGGSREDWTVDFWGPGGRGAPIGSSAGFSTADKALKYQPPPVLYMIRQGEYWRDGNWQPWPEDPHMDHTHVSWAPEGKGGGGGIFDVIGKVMEFMRSIAKFPSLPVLGGELAGYASKTLLPGVKDYLIEKLQSIAGSLFGGGSKSGLTLADAIMQGGWPANVRKTAIGVAWEESSARADARNASGAYGLFQIMKETAEGLGADYNRLGDPIYNSQVAAKLWGSQGWSPWVAYPPSQDSMSRGHVPVTGYRRGGIIPGPKGMKFLAEVEAGERILPLGVVDAFDRLAGSIDMWRRDGAEFLGTSLAGALAGGEDPVVSELQAIRQENAENAAVQAALLDALPPKMKRSVDENIERDPRTQKAVRKGLRNSEPRASLSGSRGWNG